MSNMQNQSCSCQFNDGVECTVKEQNEKKCSRCGWNPVVAAKRSKKINAEIQRKEEIKK